MGVNKILFYWWFFYVIKVYCGNINSLVIFNCLLYIVFLWGFIFFIFFNVIGNFWVISKVLSILCFIIGKYKGYILEELGLVLSFIIEKNMFVDKII